MTGVRTYAAKRDKNETPIVNALEKCGATVDRLPGGKGRPDLLVGFRGRTILIEVKMPGGKLEDTQGAYHEWWRGSKIHVVENEAQAIAVLVAAAQV